MSAWYIFSALGFYPVHPAGGKYVFGSPLVNEAILDVGNNRKFEILVKNNSPENKYIQRIILNHHPYTKPFLLHSDIMMGGSLEIFMGKKPSHTWGTNSND